MQAPRNAIRHFRLLADLPQWQLAQQVGRSQGWLCQVERGTLVPAEADLQKLSHALGVDLSVYMNSRGAK